MKFGNEEDKLLTVASYGYGHYKKGNEKKKKMNPTTLPLTLGGVGVKITKK